MRLLISKLPKNGGIPHRRNPPWSHKMPKPSKTYSPAQDENAMIIAFSPRCSMNHWGTVVNECKWEGKKTTGFSHPEHFGHFKHFLPLDLGLASQPHLFWKIQPQMMRKLRKTPGVWPGIHYHWPWPWNQKPSPSCHQLRTSGPWRLPPLVEGSNKPRAGALSRELRRPKPKLLDLPKGQHLWRCWNHPQALGALLGNSSKWITNQPNSYMTRRKSDFYRNHWNMWPQILTDHRWPMLPS